MNVTSEIIAPGMPLTCRWERDVTLLRAMVALSAALSTACVSVAKQDHPKQITVNGKNYSWPKWPVVVVLIDGGDPAYVNAAMAPDACRTSARS